jgi:hypothetical protein
VRNRYQNESLGRIWDDRTGQLTIPLFHLRREPAAVAGRPPLATDDVPYSSIESAQTLQESVEKTVDFFSAGGTLSLDLAIMGATGGLDWHRETGGSSTTVHILQKCTCVVGHSAIDLSALTAALATADATELGQYLHRDVLALGDGDDAAAAVDSIVGAHGSRFVSKVLKGGVVFRRITFSSRSSKTIDTLRAHARVWMGLGPFKISFAVSVLKELGTSSSDVDVSIQTFAAGGRREIFQPTIDLGLATQQLQDWQQSVRLGENAVPIAAELTPLSRAYVPLGSRHCGLEVSLATYRAHVAEAVRALARMDARITTVEACVEGAFGALIRAGLDQGAANARIDPVRRHVRACASVVLVSILSTATCRWCYASPSTL